MKKLSVILLLCLATVSASAQLKVKSDGTVSVGGYDSYSGYHINLLARTATSTSGYHIGVLGNAEYTANSNNSGITCGVYGHAYNNLTGMNYGVAGDLNSSSIAGAGVFGSNQGIMGYNISGKYAGYFLGNVHVAGTLSASTIQSSDLRLKENISPLSSRKENTLDKVLDMNVVEYNYKPMIPSLKLPDSVSIDSVMKHAGIDSEKKHFGLIAQELHPLYPELVVEEQSGYLAINYVELVPILIRSIQELKQQLDEVKSGRNEEPVSSRRTQLDFDEEETANANGATSITAATLYQNVPNPFTERTTIRFTLPDDVQNAYIYVFDMQGKMLKQIPIDASMQSVTINGYELQAGMYIYSLVVNGKEIDTKRMIITK